MLKFRNPGREFLGYCEYPDEKNKKIVISNKLTGQTRLEVLIHEMLHAADIHQSEEWVDAAAKDIAKVLWKLGYGQNVGSDKLYNSKPKN